LLDETAGGQADGPRTTFQAPEVSVGGEASPLGDHVALSLLARSLLPLVDVGPIIPCVLGGRIRGIAPELLDCLTWLDLHIVGAPASMRGTIHDADDRRERLRVFCGLRPDPEAFAEMVRSLLASAVRPRSGHHEASAAGPDIVLGVETTWIAGPDGSRSLLGRAHRGIVAALADLHRREPGAVLTLPELLEAGWPDEHPIPEAGANRVYVALAHLRRLGLRNMLERFGDGYRFAPRAVVQFSA
jgi:hypothetical protein